MFIRYHPEIQPLHVIPEQSLIGLPYVFWFGTGQCRCSSKVPSRLPTLSLVEGRKRTDTSLIPMGLDCVCGRCGHWNKLGENYYMKKEKERENCPSQGGISSKINSCRGGRLKSEHQYHAILWSNVLNQWQVATTSFVLSKIVLREMWWMSCDQWSYKQTKAEGKLGGGWATRLLVVIIDTMS